MQFTDIDQTLQHGNVTIAVTIESDNDHGAPWDNEDGHGPVSDWTRRDKKPGELVLNTDRQSKRYYDYAEAYRIARRDGWNSKPYDIPGESSRQRAARAAMADYERLRDWCNDRWNYVGVIVTATDSDGEEIDSRSLWGIESDAGGYLLETANELLGELLPSLPSHRDMLVADIGV